MGILKTEVLDNLFAFFIKLANSNGPLQMTNRITIDLISVIMIHLIIDETEQLLP